MSGRSACVTIRSRIFSPRSIFSSIPFNIKHGFHHPSGATHRTRQIESLQYLSSLPHLHHCLITPSASNISTIEWPPHAAHFTSTRLHQSPIPSLPTHS